MSESAPDKRRPLFPVIALAPCGLVIGQPGFIRGGKPVVLPILALLLNGVIFITAVINLPR